jgi:hypothetical protein
MSNYSPQSAKEIKSDKGWVGVQVACRLSPEDDPVGSFKIRIWREDDRVGSFKIRPWREGAPWGCYKIRLCRDFEPVQQNFE